MHGLKRTLDPRALMNPGKIHPDGGGTRRRSAAW
ncbi:MAG: hypothetical protein DI544_02555 [Sphingomonas taxi]|uniref:Uncharacterized protein n=1 Tax=Sphingomonas taxi TaxID=1549858 RepID=A0A2W5PDE6_9SPHN|nr:MAG: hypothetical protein DI544_02555 [Sphingomonas taxi]